MKTILYILSCICILIAPDVFAQKDSLQVGALTYVSVFEEAQLQQITEQRPNYLGLMLAASPAATEKSLQQAEQKLQAFFSRLDNSKLQQKPLHKQVKQIFALAHEQFQKKYELHADFNQTITKGEYNCVSA
ncbi:MAG: hypothetical protein LPJ89_03090, partial [Hymenobacteraceae bacterium]|nr:hypothetical protein [Hymenobacteraceae bacterium]MDX5395316.1 hypothetical protein [Hymenobacteraceae bacterium]MDX5442750.1 hypothetical protein [Hymenobacteraceae bacterium]MDX5511352.1 hypothetical protein [Hymenobacteraceae bacterium]